MKFPYYIVRFKLNSFFNSPSESRPFPYYIVRFKHIEASVGAVPTQESFHTT